MAKFDSYLLGKVSKTLGNVTMCYMNKQNIARARIFSRKDKPTSEMLDQRARMKVLIELSRFLLPVVQKGFVEKYEGGRRGRETRGNDRLRTVENGYWSSGCSGSLGHVFRGK